MKLLSTILFFATVFCLATIGASAQNITYIDEDFKPATAANYTYKRAIKYKEPSVIPDGYGGVRFFGLHICSLMDYYRTGEPALVLSVISLNLNCSDWQPKGQAIHYYKNGNIKRKEFYESGKLNGTVIHYDEDGTERKREEYVNGKLIEEGKFAAPADSPIIGTWKYVEYSKAYEFSGIKVPSSVVRTATFIYSQNGVVESIHQNSNNITTSKIKGNWKYIPKSASSGVLEEYQGEDLIERGTVKWLSRDQLEYTVTFSQNSDVAGKQFAWTRQ